MQISGVGFRDSHAQYFRDLFTHPAFADIPGDYLVLDCETTGLSKACGIVQLGYAMVQNHELTQSGGIMINVAEDVPFEDGAVKVTGIDRQKSSSEGVPPIDAWRSYMDLVNDCIHNGFWICGHNLVQFDLPRFAKELNEHKVPVGSLANLDRVIDTGILAKACQIAVHTPAATFSGGSLRAFYRVVASIYSKAKWNLAFCAEFFELPGSETAGFHDAAEDCRMSHQLWQRFRSMGGLTP